MTDDPLSQSVLIVDDSPDIHHLVGARLRSEALILLHAYNAMEGLILARENLPDLILLDVDMPDTDGMTVCRQLKEDPTLFHIPVIFITGMLDVPTKVAAFEMGAVDYVTKPFDAVELKARVKAALRTKRYHDLLTTKARIDALTGLWNRGYFDDQLDIELSLVRRGGPPVSLAMIDIDHFKPVNDTYGHLFGDQIIQRVAGILSQRSRDSDIVCRYGGEEFIIILRDTAKDGAYTLAERIRKDLESVALKAGKTPVPVTVSIGIAGSDQYADIDTLSGPALLKAADSALYRAKNSGRNRVE